MKFFSKLKDNNTLLEEILEMKTFSSVAKSLLLSMIYKLEISYKDYFQVKVGCITKDKFFKNILEIIKNYCDNIKIVEPDSSQAKLLLENNVDAVTNYKERSIMAYPTEMAMLYAISDIEPKYFFMKNTFLLKHTFQNVLVKGYKMNTMEVLKNFNGWSWDINPKNASNCIENIIYQNLIEIMGEDFLYDWRITNTAKRDFMKELKNHIKKVTGSDNYYNELVKLLYLLSTKNEKNIIQKVFKEKKLEFENLISDKDKASKKANEIKIYDELINLKKTEYEQLVEVQKCFLEYVEKKIEAANTSDTIIEILYFLRYYQNIVFFEGVLIKNYRPIRDIVNNILRDAITKICKIGAVKIISMNIETNYEILKYVLDTKILNLENIKIVVDLEDNYILIKEFDKEIFEKQGKIKFSGNKKDIVIKRKKKIKIFN